MKFQSPYQKVFTFLVFSFFVGSLTAHSISTASLLQQNPELLTEWLEKNELSEFAPVATRSPLPDHFFAERIYPEKSFEPVVFEIEDQAVVLFWMIDAGDREVVVLSEDKADGYYFYDFEGLYGQRNSAKLSEKFSIPQSGKVLLEWNGPLDQVEDIIINRSDHRVYRSIAGHSFISTGFGAALDCHFNINCSEGEDFNQLSDAVNRIMVVVEEGIGFCSGALINNTAEDFTPYILSAFHCMANFTPLYHLWRFDFFYNSENCDDPISEPDFFSMIGAKFRAGHPDSDFLLLELSNGFPSDFEVPFLGWDRREDYLPVNTALVHHPAGDIKKVSSYSEPLRVHNNLINWNHGIQTPRRSHYRQQLTTGTFEPGSSGSPLLSPESRIMGQLHGGVFGCDGNIAYSGILHYSWDVGDDPSERLRDWLDPINTGQLTLDELLLAPELIEIEVAGRVSNPLNRNIPDVLIELVCGDTTYFTLTDEEGEFALNIVFIDEEDCIVHFSKQDEVMNGINVLDIVLIRRDILGLQILDDWQRLAADVNDDGLVNVLDIVVLRRMILGIYDELPDVDPWLFSVQSDVIELRADNSLFLDVTGMKMGDLDYNADY
ncbi:MAG: hypothetical protein EA362_10780 [Saprospirales bacterium]|nr:MAG: hypothetical protein EA362_10780 [Saprospirales bacterium]